MFTDPDRFRPERFLEQPAPRDALIPFGGGARRCVGASFALMEIKTILRTVLERVDLDAPSAAPERPVRWRRFTTIPGRGGRVIVRHSAARIEPRARTGARAGGAA